MAGNEDNQNILIALNQLIKAINDQTLVANCAPAVNFSCPPPVINVHVSQSGVVTCDSPSGTIEARPVDPPTNPSNLYVDELKCLAANIVFDWYVGWFRFIAQMASYWGSAASVLDFLSEQVLSVSALAAAGILAGTALAAFFLAPEVILLAVIAGLSAMIGAAESWLVLTVFGSLADELEANKEELICQLYNSGSVPEAKAVLLDFCDNIIPTLAQNPIPNVELDQWAVEKIEQGIFEVVHLLLFNNPVNLMFTDDETLFGPDEYDPPAAPVNCASCQEFYNGWAILTRTQYVNHIGWLNNVGENTCLNWPGLVGQYIPGNGGMRVIDVSASGCDYWHGKLWALSPQFTQSSGSVTFTIAGGTHNGDDPQWHLAWRNTEGWQGNELFNAGNGTYTINLPAGCTQLFLFYNSPFLFVGNPYVYNIVLTGCEVTAPPLG
jgi:hypothetical protein